METPKSLKIDKSKIEKALQMDVSPDSLLADAMRKKYRELENKEKKSD
mgnify:CR=1 FL=1|tara:strand:+ start:6588 stop:6731 length:144 start_codon:yes stop_codon:yes gene_type:complete